MVRRQTENSFYNKLDVESLDPREPDEYRTAFQTDRDRIIYSSAFRRLQAKTQVFLSGEFDFYRTRLTHSLEVAQTEVMREANSLNQIRIDKEAHSPISWFPTLPDLVRHICCSS